MELTTDSLIDNNLVNHTKFTIADGEDITFYIDKKTGLETLERYTTDASGNMQYVDTIKTINLGHSDKDHSFIRETFSKLDKIIDLDFIEMSHNNGSMIDIYHISYSSHFRDDVIGQALSQKTMSGGWWDIFWKDNPLPEENKFQNSDHNTIIHEIGHTLGLSHPFNDPKNKLWNSQDTIMSYNRGESDWSNWFSRSDLNALIKIWGRENDNGYITYDKNSFEYKFKKQSETEYSIKTHIGYESISEVENLIFRDKEMNVQSDIIDVFKLVTSADDITGKIYRLYNAAFSRFPDANGLKYWIDKNTLGVDSYRDTANSFLASKEFIMKYGNQTTNEEYLNNVYENVLGRLPDTIGFNYWINQLNRGHENRAEILMGFAESVENKQIFSAETNVF